MVLGHASCVMCVPLLICAFHGSWPPGSRLVVSDAEITTRAAVAGLGIAPAPASLAAPYIAKKKLVPVLAKWTPPPIEVHAVFPPGGALVPKTRAFLDRLKTCFEAQPANARFGQKVG